MKRDCVVWVFNLRMSEGEYIQGLEVGLVKQDKSGVTLQEMYKCYTRTGLKGLERNTMGKAIKHLRLLLKNWMRRKIISPIDLSEYKAFEEVADATYMSNYEIETIYKLDLLLNTKLETARDLLILGCLTGLRFSDFSISNRKTSGTANCISNNKNQITG